MLAPMPETLSPHRPRVGDRSQPLVRSSRGRGLAGIAHGSAPPPHFHPAQDERFEVLEGELSAVVDGAERTLRAGRHPRHPARGGAQDVEPGDDSRGPSGRRGPPAAPSTGGRRSTTWAAATPGSCRNPEPHPARRAAGRIRRRDAAGSRPKAASGRGAVRAGGGGGASVRRARLAGLICAPPLTPAWRPVTVAGRGDCDAGPLGRLIRPIPE